MPHFVAFIDKSYKKTKEQINQEQNIEISFHRYNFHRHI